MGPAMCVDRRIAAVVGQQRPEHRGVGQEEDAAGVEEDRVEIREKHGINLTLQCA
jgi:hypothetical protein